MTMDRAERAELMEATMLRAAEEGCADIADDRGVSPDVHEGIGYATREGVDRLIERAVAAIAEPELTEAEEREWERRDSQAHASSGSVREQILHDRH